MSETRFTRVPGYVATSDGRILSVVHDWRGYGEREMCTHLDKHGYQLVRLTADGRRRKYRVHQLVCEAFHGSRPTPQHEVRHLDGSRDNNCSDNLCWGTRSENARDRVSHGTQFMPPWHDPAFRQRVLTAKKISRERGVNHG